MFGSLGPRHRIPAGDPVVGTMEELFPAARRGDVRAGARAELDLHALGGAGRR